MAAIEVREHCGGAQEKGDQFTKFQLWLTITRPLGRGGGQNFNSFILLTSLVAASKKLGP